MHMGVYKEQAGLGRQWAGSTPVVDFSSIAGRLEAQEGRDAALDAVTADHSLAPQPLPAA